MPDTYPTNPKENDMSATLSDKIETSPAFQALATKALLADRTDADNRRQTAVESLAQLERDHVRDTASLDQEIAGCAEEILAAVQLVDTAKSNMKSLNRWSMQMKNDLRGRAAGPNRSVPPGPSSPTTKIRLRQDPPNCSAPDLGGRPLSQIDKKSLSEADIRTKFITPAIEQAGWDLLAQVREEVYFTKGRVIVKGKTVSRGKAKFADYILYFKPQHSYRGHRGQGQQPQRRRDGMQQAIGLCGREVPRSCRLFSAPTAMPSGSTTAPARSVKVEQELTLDAFPAPAVLWQHYCKWKGINQAAEQIVSQDYYADSSGKSPRYYQHNAINRTVEAIAKGQDRILLGDGDRHGQDLHGLPDYLASVEGGREESAYSSWPTEISSSTRPARTTSSPSAGR